MVAKATNEGLFGFTSEDVDVAADASPAREYRQLYDGPMPMTGVYQWTVTNMVYQNSSNGHKQLSIGLELTDRPGRPEQSEYKGFYVRDFIVVLPTTAFKWGRLLKEIGATRDDLLKRTVVDELSGEVLSIGDVTVAGVKLLAQLRVNRGVTADEYPRVIGQYGR